MFRLRDFGNLFGDNVSISILIDEWERQIVVPHISISCLRRNIETLANEYFRELQDKLETHANNWRPPRYPFRIIMRDDQDNHENQNSTALRIPVWFMEWTKSRGIEVRFLSDLKFFSDRKIQKGENA